MSYLVLTVSISGLDQDSPQPQPWKSKIVAGNKVNRLYSQQLFRSARAGAGAGSCLDQDQISILYIGTGFSYPPLVITKNSAKVGAPHKIPKCVRASIFLNIVFTIYCDISMFTVVSFHHIRIIRIMVQEA